MFLSTTWITLICDLKIDLIMFEPSFVKFLFHRSSIDQLFNLLTFGILYVGHFFWTFCDILKHDLNLLLKPFQSSTELFYYVSSLVLFESHKEMLLQEFSNDIDILKFTYHFLIQGVIFIFPMPVQAVHVRLYSTLSLQLFPSLE